MANKMQKNPMLWANAFDATFRLKKAYMLANNIPPNSYSKPMGDRTIDLKSVNIETLKKNYPESIITVNEVANSKEKEQDEIEEYIDLSGELWMDTPFERDTINIYDNDIFYEIGTNNVLILYKEGNPEELFDSLISNFKIIESEPVGGEVSLVAYSQGYYTVTSKIKPTTINLDENYNDNFKESYEAIAKFLNDRASGLVLMSGLPGTGKTSVIRHIITNIPKDYVIVTNAIAENMASPDFISFLLENKDSVFILEDCENILKERGVNAFGGAISNLLNMSDGLMSDIFNIKFICTFNADITGIDPALLRKGRCYANYEFKKLCKEKTKVLLNKQGIELNEYKDMTLADIYNYSSIDTETEIQKIGF